LLKRARETGHSGRLCGVDPDEAALKLARRREDIEWVAGVAATMTFSQEFEVAVMTGHAFQCLVTDDDVRTSLASIRRTLSNGGRFVFETRNPSARAWETWRPENATDVVDLSGRELRISHDVEDVSGEIVTFTETTAEPGGAPLRVDRAALRFLTVDALEAFLREAGFVIEAEFGGWSREPLAPASPEIIVIAASAPA
jgi:SAM-dependent methyltransferase